MFQKVQCYIHSNLRQNRPLQWLFGVLSKVVVLLTAVVYKAVSCFSLRVKRGKEKKMQLENEDLQRFEWETCLSSFEVMYHRYFLIYSLACNILFILKSSPSLR